MTYVYLARTWMTRMLSCWSIWPVWNIHSIVLKGTSDIAHFCPSSFVPKCHTERCKFCNSALKSDASLPHSGLRVFQLLSYYLPTHIFPEKPPLISASQKKFPPTFYKSSSLDYNLRVEDNQFLSVKFHGWIHRNTLLHFRWLPYIEYLTCVGYG